MLSMEGSTEAAPTGSPTPTFSQVVFIDIPHSYPPSTQVTCCYTLNAALQPNPRDWVGIFKVGWSTTKDYHTFVWVEPCLDVVGQQSMTRQAVFKEYYLPKDEIEFYQFCYIDSTGQVRGASTPFCFRNPAEQSMESSQDEDLLVITTQEQLEQSGRVKAELQKELDRKMDENETLKRALEKEQQDAAGLKGQIEENEKEKSELVKERDHIKEENENLKGTLQNQLKETDHLKEMLTQMTKQMEERTAAEQKSASLSLDGASRQNEAHKEKYDRAVAKINQLKEERDELRRKIDAQGDEMTTLNSKNREQDRELFKMKNSIQLLQVDLQSSEKEKERLFTDLQRLQSLAQDMDNMKRENQDLCRRLSQQDTVQTCQDDDLRGQCQTLARQLRDAREELAAEREESRNIRRRGDFLDKELQEIREQLKKQVLAHEEAQQMSSKKEFMLRDAHESIADKCGIIEDNERMMKLLSEEKEELTRENQNLHNDMEELRRAYAELHAAPPADTTHCHAQPGTTSPAANTSFTPEWQQPEAPEQADDLYENIEGVQEPEEEALVCRHCQESFPLITRQELEQHEQSHRVCPFCTMICDNMEQSVFEDHVYGHEL